MLNIELPYDLAIPLLGVYPREMKTCIYIHEDLYRNDLSNTVTIAKK